MTEAQFWSIYFRLVDHLLGDTAQQAAQSDRGGFGAVHDHAWHTTRNATAAAPASHAVTGNGISQPASHAQSQSDNLSAWEHVQPASEQGHAQPGHTTPGQARGQDDLDAYLKVRV